MAIQAGVGVQPVASPRRRRWRLVRSFRSPSMAVAALMLLAVVAFVVAIPLVGTYDPYSQNLGARTLPPLSSGRDGRLYLLGTDSLGRDLMSRLALAGRVSLLLAVGAVVVSMVIGVGLGLTAGYFGGRVENAIMGLADIQLSIPRILLVIAVVAVVGPSLANLALVLGITSWVGYARVVRAETLSLRERDFVQAAGALGATPGRIMLRHVLPNTLPSALILGSLELGQIVTLEASLSFLGLGVQPPLPAWGSMIQEGQAFLRSFPLLTILPGLAIFMVVGGVNFVTQAFTSERRVARSANSGV
jgi:peptide/nickel transport system permease protein